MWIESFFQTKSDEQEEISIHVAKLRKLFADLNVELEKHGENKISNRKLNSRILSTLREEYDNFKDLRDVIPTDQQKLSFLIEKLELRKKLLINETAFVVKDVKNINKLSIKKGRNLEQNGPCKAEVSLLQMW